MEVMRRTWLLAKGLASRDSGSNTWWKGPSNRIYGYWKPYAHNGETEENGSDNDEYAVN